MRYLLLTLCLIFVTKSQAQYDLFSHRVSSIPYCANIQAVFLNLQPNRTHYTYHWDFGDGTTSTDSMSPRHTYTSSGTYTVRLTMTGPRPALVLKYVRIHGIPTGWKEPGADLDGPDLKILLSNTVNSDLIFDDIKRNTKGVLPQTFNINKLLDLSPHQIKMEEWDLVGPDDPLGSRIFTPAFGRFRDTIRVSSSGVTGNLDIEWEIDTTSQLMDSQQITVQPSPFPATLTRVGDSTFCQGEGSAIIYANRDPNSTSEWFRNSASYSTSQADSIIVTTGGNFWLRSTLAGCRIPSRDSAWVGVYAIPTADFLPAGDTTFICGDTGYVALNATNQGSSNQYQWLFNGQPIADETNKDLGILRAQEGNYQLVLVGLGGCRDTSRQIYAKRVPLPEDSIYKRIGPRGDTIFATPGFANYEWYANGQFYASTRVHWFTPTEFSGNYCARVRDSQGCLSDKTNTIKAVVGLDEELALAGIHLFPNPAASTCTITSEAFLQNPALNIISVVGKKISYTQLDSGTKWKLPLTDLPAGIYIVTLSAEGKSLSKLLRVF